ncbi:MAG: hypothetical protein ABL958_03125 [Bdellovibrionia bacterium]
MKTIVKLLSILMILTAASVASAQQLEVFDQDKELPTLKWQRVIGENMLREQIMGALTPLVKDLRFNVFISIRLKTLKSRQARGNRVDEEGGGDVVDLGKLGTAGPAINDEAIAKGQLWAQVEYIKTEVVLYDHAPTEMVDMMEQVTRKIVVSAVPAWRTGVTVTAPKFEFAHWFYDRKVLVGVLAGCLVFSFLGAFLLLNFFYSQRYRNEENRPVFSGFPKFRDVQPALSDAKVIQISALPVNEPASRVNEVNDSFDPEVFGLPSDPQAWISMIEANPSLGAVLANIVPPEAAARVYAALPVDVVRKMTESAMSMSEDDVQKKANDLKRVVASMATKRPANAFLDHAVELVGRVGPAREGVFFANMISAGRFDLLEEAARKYFPAHLIPGLPTLLLKSLINTMSPEARAELVLCVEDKYKGQFLEAIGEKGTKVREYVESQVKAYETDTARKADLAKRGFHVWWDFVKLVRRTVTKDVEFARATEFLLKNWLQEQKVTKKSGGRGAA